jgi:hypothetical protein
MDQIIRALSQQVGTLAKGRLERRSRFLTLPHTERVLVG